MKYFVYILRSLRDGKRYIGSTSDVKKRLKSHNEGGTLSTKNRIPLILTYYEEFNSKSEALKREKFFKSGKGREYLKSQNL